MKLPTRELPLLMLPCLGLLAFGLWPKPAPRAPLWGVSGPVAAPTGLPQASVSIRWPEKLPGAGSRTSAEVTLIHSSLSLAPRPPGASVRWYYNCRIEGSLHNGSQVFYSSSEQDPYGCGHSLTLGTPTLSSSGLQQRFLLRRLPPEALGLVYTVEAVALAGALSPAQAVSQHELQQARRSSRRLGYAINSIPLSVPNS